MAKKGSKKFDAPEGAVEQAAPQVEVKTAEQAAPEGEDTTEATVSKAQLFLEDANGVQYQIVRRPKLPKRADKAPDGDFQIIVDGESVPVWTTNSKGFSAPDKVIEYIWVDLNDGAERGFITLDYMVPANSWEGLEFTLGQGKANREDPARISKDQAKEDARKELFRQTMAKKKAEAAAETPETPEQPEGEQTTESANQ